MTIFWASKGTKLLSSFRLPDFTQATHSIYNENKCFVLSPATMSFWKVDLIDVISAGWLAALCSHSMRIGVLISQNITLHNYTIFHPQLWKCHQSMIITCVSFRVRALVCLSQYYSLSAKQTFREHIKAKRAGYRHAKKWHRTTDQTTCTLCPLHSTYKIDYLNKFLRAV